MPLCSVLLGSFLVEVGMAFLWNYVDWGTSGPVVTQVLWFDFES